jgi:Zn-dependent oligopeptidase
MEIIEYDNNSWKFDENIKIVRVSKKNGETIGDLILDLYPRANKYSHACFLPIISSVLKPFSCTELEELPIAFIIANFNKPTNDHDGLLKYDEVRTFFHEFGHALHGLFGATEYLSQSGTSVDADFVETPSQLFEQWLLNKDIVKSISYHYKTGESLSDEVIKKIINLEFYNIGLFYQGQLNKSLLALELFLYPNKSVSQIREELEEKTVSLTPISELSQYVYSFGHLASSLYGPKYYAYLWSFVYAIDFFTYIKSKNGMLDPKIGAKLKDKVLSKGGSIDSNSLINSFLEREPNINNFYEYIKNR